ncbi:MAG: HNH endonuclease [Rhabdaerophilum sp.]
MGRLRQLPARLGGMAARVKAMPKVAERFYLSAEWRAYRSAHRAWTKARQGGVWCCVCGSVARLILDHRVERKDGGADFPPYEEADWYCGGCHNTKTAKARHQRAGGG